MSSDKQMILRWFARTEFPANLLDFDTLLIEAAVNALGKSAIDAAAFSASKASTYWNWIQQLLQADKGAGATLYNPAHSF
jgi:hypothetical protein